MVDVERAPARRASALVRRSESIRVDDCTPRAIYQRRAQQRGRRRAALALPPPAPNRWIHARIPRRNDLRAAARTTSSPPAAPPPAVRLLRAPRKGITHGIHARIPRNSATDEDEARDEIARPSPGVERASSTKRTPSNRSRCSPSASRRSSHRASPSAARAPWRAPASCRGRRAPRPPRPLFPAILKTKPSKIRAAVSAILRPPDRGIAPRRNPRNGR